MYTLHHSLNRYFTNAVNTPLHLSHHSMMCPLRTDLGEYFHFGYTSSRSQHRSGCQKWGISIFTSCPLLADMCTYEAQIALRKATIIKVHVKWCRCTVEPRRTNTLVRRTPRLNGRFGAVPSIFLLKPIKKLPL